MSYGIVINDNCIHLYDRGRSGLASNHWLSPLCGFDSVAVDHDNFDMTVDE